jgi:hypothetical protein
MILLENPVGRLCEIRADGSVTSRDLIAFRARLATIFSSVPSRVVICSDLRDCANLPDDVVQALVTIARIDNPRIERHAMLGTPGQTICTQLETVIRAAGSDARQLFDTPSDARSWLEPVLTQEEVAHLRRFLEG